MTVHNESPAGYCHSLGLHLTATSLHTAVKPLLVYCTQFWSLVFKMGIETAIMRRKLLPGYPFTYSSYLLAEAKSV